VRLPEGVAQELDDAVLLVQVAQRRLVRLRVDGRALRVALADLESMLKNQFWPNFTDTA
jgi:hypothetical protein